MKSTVNEMLLLIMFLLFLLTLITISWKFMYKWKNGKLLNLYKLFQSRIPDYPLIGHLYLFYRDDVACMNGIKTMAKDAFKNQYGIVNFWAGPIHFAMVCDPKAAECILKASTEKGLFSKCMRFVTGNGLIFAPSTIWRPRRKVMAPVFSQKNLNQFVNIFVKKSQEIADKLTLKVDSGPFSIWKYMFANAIDTVCETTLGIKLQSETTPDQLFIKSFEIILNIMSARFSRLHLHNDTVFRLSSYGRKASKYAKSVYEFFEKIIKEKRLSIQNQSQQANVQDDGRDLRTFLDLIFKSSDSEKSYTNREIVEEMLVLIVAGTDTSTVGVCFTMILLSRYQDVQHKVYEEIQEILGDTNMPLQLQDLGNFKYTEAVIKESLRLYPPVAATDRTLASDVKLPSGITLYEGMSILINIWGIHHNPRYWGSDVEEFKPERFMNGSVRYPTAFLPFSHGPRNCLGYQYAMMSIKVNIIVMLRKFRLLPVKFTEDDDFREPLRLKYDIMTKHVHDFKIQLKNR